MSVGYDDEPVGGERLLGGDRLRGSGLEDGAMDDDYEGSRRPRSCLGRVAPLLCRCLSKLRRPGGGGHDSPREYGKIEAGGATRNPVHDAQREALRPPEVEVTEQRLPRGGYDDDESFAPLSRMESADLEDEAFGDANASVDAAPLQPRSAGGPRSLIK